MSTSPSPTPDWPSWYARWEAQQSRHMPHREERFAVIVAALGAFCGDRFHAVDLGCGPGSLAQRILAAYPDARVTAVDMDPVLLEIGRQALGDTGQRLRFVDADLRGPWDDSPAGPLDGAVSTTALHWLQGDAITSLYSRLGALIRPGGVFLNGDHLAFDSDEHHIADAVRAMRESAPVEDEPGGGPPVGETWEEWWAAVEQDAGLAALVAERSRRHHDHPDHDHQAGFAFHRQALLNAGFSEVDTLWQRLSDRVLVAVR
jgi:SAM-dependent methyltransferase